MSDVYSETWRKEGLPELKDCPLPFCEGHGTYNASETISIFCTDCGLTLDNEFGGDFGCIELWNARSPQEIDALFEAGQYHHYGDSGAIEETAVPGFNVFMGVSDDA